MIGKTAGTSLMSVIRNKISDLVDANSGFLSLKVQGQDHGVHTYLVDLISSLKIGAEPLLNLDVFNSMYKFAIVSHSFHRTVSLFSFWHKL